MVKVKLIWSLFLLYYVQHCVSLFEEVMVLRRVYFSKRRYYIGS